MWPTSRYVDVSAQFPRERRLGAPFVRIGCRQIGVMARGRPLTTRSADTSEILSKNREVICVIAQVMRS
jgi:hypothetical protein